MLVGLCCWSKTRRLLMQLQRGGSVQASHLC